MKSEKCPTLCIVVCDICNSLHISLRVHNQELLGVPLRACGASGRAIRSITFAPAALRWFRCYPSRAAGCALSRLPTVMKKTPLRGYIAFVIRYALNFVFVTRNSLHQQIAAAQLCRVKSPQNLEACPLLACVSAQVVAGDEGARIDVG